MQTHVYHFLCNDAYMSNSIADRIKRLRKEAGLSQQKVADAIGVSRVAVTKWESGQTQDMKRSSLSGMAKLFKVSVEELIGGKPKSINVSPTLLTSTRIVPLIAKVPAGNWRTIFDDFSPGAGMSYELASEECGPNTFALIVSGDSMEPDFKEGDKIFVDPDKTPKPGSFVVARNHHLEPTFKQYKARGVDANGKELFELVPLNDSYPTIRSDEFEIEIIGTVTEFRRPLK